MATYTNKNGTAAADTLVYDQGGSGVVYHTYGGSDKVTIKGGTINLVNESGNDVIDILGGSGHNINGGDNSETLNINGGAAVTALLGSGKDFINIINSNGKNGSTLSAIRGGAWTDTFTTEKGAQNYQLYGDEGNDIFNIKGGVSLVCWGGAANDTFNVTGGTGIKLRGGDSADTYNISTDKVDMQLGYGNDLVVVTAGNNHTIKANLGINEINLEAGSGHVITADIDQAASRKMGYTDAQIKAGEGLGYGVDTVKISGAASQVTAHLGDGKDVVEVSGGSGHKIYTEGWGDTINISGTTSSSTFDAGAGEDIINVYGGYDNSIRAGVGNDKIKVSNAAQFSFIHGDEGDDTLECFGKYISLYGDAGKDTIYFQQATGCSGYGGAGDDRLYLKGTDNCTVYGEAGKDIITVYGNNNTVYGDYSSEHGYEQDATGSVYDDNITLEAKAVSCKAYGGKGADTINIYGSKCTIDGGIGNDKFVLKATSGNEVYGGTGMDQFTIQTGRYTDDEGNVLNNNPYAKLSGGAGKDTFSFTRNGTSSYSLITAFGGSGNDTFDMKGADIMAIGGTGNDTFYTYTGQVRDGNYMCGGAGDDTYVIDVSEGVDSQTNVYIDNRTYHAAGDKDVLQIKNLDSQIGFMSVYVPKYGGTYRRIEMKCGYSVLRIWLDGLADLSSVQIQYKGSSEWTDYGTGSQFLSSILSHGQNFSSDFSFEAPSAYIEKNYDAANYGSVADFIKKDADLLITGNGL